MAAKNVSDDKHVTRISAADNTAQSTDKRPSKRSEKTAKPRREKRQGYFRGAWYELRQVHWPTRRATWSLTAAVLGFSAFFVVFILVLDALFKVAFEQILK